MSVVLTLDLGTSTVKAALWRGHHLLGLERASLLTVHTQPGFAEQEPASWWEATLEACAALRAVTVADFAGIETVAFSSARETFGCFDADLEPLGTGLLWSDRRAAVEAELLGDPEEFRAVTGVRLTAGCTAAKVAWIASHEPARFAAIRWILSPRDYVLARLTGEVVTEPTMASRTGWYSLGDTPLCGDSLARRLPTMRTATARFPITDAACAALGIGAGAAAIPGAGDRACEVLGSGAAPNTPMISWGTTANLSVPHDGPVGALPTVAQVSRRWDTGFVVEAGLSAAAEAISWLAQLTRTPVDAVWSAAAATAPGADGVRCQAWFNGARSPWWEADARAAFSGLTPESGLGPWSRAVVESVASDVARSIEVVAPGAAALMLVGGGAANPVWRSILGGVTDLPLVERRSAEAASVGARLLAAMSTGLPLGVDAVNPVVALHRPDRDLVEQYRMLRPEFDATAERFLGR